MAVGIIGALTSRIWDVRGGRQGSWLVAMWQEESETEQLKQLNVFVAEVYKQVLPRHFSY